MLTLCLNTAGYTNTLAIMQNKKYLAEKNWASERNETETVLSYLIELLAKNDLIMEQVQALHIIQGTGGFTSLRVGISIFNTLAYLYQLPIFGSSVFELWYERLPSDKQNKTTILIDAGRQTCFYFKKFLAKEKNPDFFSPQIIPNAQITELKEKFWIGEINDVQHKLLPSNLQIIESLKSPGEAFAAINLQNKKPRQILEPWYGREPNISQAKRLGIPGEVRWSIL